MRTVESPYAGRLARIPVSQHETEVDGLPASWWEYGDPASAPTLLLVHGFRGDHHGLEPVVAFLPGAHVVAPDLPGFGLSAPLPGEHSIDAYAAWLRAFLETVGLREDTVVIGHSFGTIIAAKALADGLPVARGILMNPIAAPALAGPNAVGTRLASLYYGIGARLPERAGLGWLNLPVVVRGAGAFLAKTRERSLRRWIHDQHDRYFSGYADRRVVLEAYRASVEHDVSEWADALTMPIDLIAAEHDDITALKDVEALAARLPRASLEVIPSVGHLVHYETPDAAARRIAAVTGIAAG